MTAVESTKTRQEKTREIAEKYLADKDAREKQRVDKLLEQKAIEKDNRRSVRYLRETPVSQSERDFYLKEGRTPEKEPWYFEPSQRFIIWKLDEHIDAFKARHGRLPAGYAYRESLPEATAELIRYPVEV